MCRACWCLALLIDLWQSDKAYRQDLQLNRASSIHSGKQQHKQTARKPDAGTTIGVIASTDRIHKKRSCLVHYSPRLASPRPDAKVTSMMCTNFVLGFVHLRLTKISPFAKQAEMIL